MKRNMFSYTIGSVIYCACQWLLLVLVVQIADYSEAGVFSLATSVTASPALVALYGMRNYQVSDMDGKYHDNDYLFARVVSSALAMLLCLCMIMIGRYSLYKSIVIIVYMLVKIVEAIADHYYSVEQKAGRMDYSGISMIISGVGSVILFTITYRVANKLYLSLLLVALYCLTVLLLYDQMVIRVKGFCDRCEMSFSSVKLLLIECFPIALTGYLNNLSIMIPRLFLEKYYGEEVMGAFASVASPTAVVHLLATSMFAPLIVSLTMNFKQKNAKAIISTLSKFTVAGIAVSIFGLVIAGIAGEWILVLLYGEEIRSYVYVFIPVIIMTILLAFNTCLFSVCTVMRVLKEQYFRGILGVISSVLLGILLVKEFGTLGVVYASVGSILIQMIMQLFMIGKRIKVLSIGEEL